MIVANWNGIGILLKATWVPGQGCVIVETQSTILAATFIYSMVFDLIVLSLTAFKLLSPPAGRSRLVELIFNDGLIYFVIALVISILFQELAHSGHSVSWLIWSPLYAFLSLLFPCLIFDRYLCLWTSTPSCQLSQTSLLRLRLRFVSLNSWFPRAQWHYGRLLLAVLFDGWVTLRRKVHRCSRTSFAPCITRF